MRSTRVGMLAFGAVMVVALQAIAQRNSFQAVPLDGLTPAQRLAWEHGSRTFSKAYRVADGLGPLFNDDACVRCHGVDARSNIFGNTRFGWRENDVFDPLAELGGSLVQSHGIGPITTVDGTYDFVAEAPPPEANVTTPRQTQPLRGLGFVDAVPDATWLAIAEAELAADPATAGRVHMVFNFASGSAAVGKFGWKAQVPTLFQFAGDALLNEIGITSPLGFREELCPQGDCLALAFNPTPALNDDGRDVAALTDFMTMLAAPTRGTITSVEAAGESVFEETGCAGCHLPSIQTGPSPVAALDRTSFHPYSDFLLHDMGSLGDGIGQGNASGHEMRTTPLWGLRNATRFLHDGSAVTVTEAILRHDGQGRASRDRFTRLGPRLTASLLAFLRSL